MIARELSHPIVDGLQVYPGDPPVRVEPALTVSRDGVDVTALHFGSHTGTHLDAPSHTIVGGRTTGQISLDELVAEALVLHLGTLPPHSMYGLPEITEAFGSGLPQRVPPIVMIDTGWARAFGSDVALTHPALDPSAATELLDRGMHVLVVDTLSPDPTQPDSAFPVHQVVLGADALIVENIRGLDGLPATVSVGLFPLPIDADGAPIRAVVFER